MRQKYIKSNIALIIVAALIALVMVSLSFVALVSTNTTTQTARKANSSGIIPASLTTSGKITLSQTYGFKGISPQGNEVFKGTAYYYYIGYGSGGETNPNYNWYIVGIEIDKGVKQWRDIGGTYMTSEVDSNHVWDTNGAPISKSPFPSSTSISVGTGGASVGVTLDSQGYDRGLFQGGAGATWGSFVWYHNYTMADQNGWNTIQDAFLAKVSATSSQASVTAYVWPYFYMWYTGGWNPFASTSGYIWASYVSGAYSGYTYPTSVK